MSETVTVVQALSAVMADVRSVGKDGRNQAQNYSFRGVDAVVNAVGPVLRKHGVVVVPAVEDVSYRDVRTSNDKPARECTVKVRYTFYGPAGDHIDCVTPGESLDSSDKGAPKAMSVAYRIALLQALCLPTDDRDPDADHHERAIGSGTPPPDTAKAALSALGKAVKAAGLDPAAVDEKYQSLNGVALKDEDDTARIREFTNKLTEHMAVTV